MAFKGFKKIRLEDDSANRAVEAIKEFVDQFNFSLIYGRFLTEDDTQIVSLSTTAKQLPHKLDEKYKGFLVAENDSNAVIYNTRSDNDNQFITLTASASCKAKIWVF